MSFPASGVSRWFLDPGRVGNKKPAARALDTKIRRYPGEYPNVTSRLLSDIAADGLGSAA